MGGVRVFVSYCHKQGEWVWDRLVPCLKAGGVEVLIDRERFLVGKNILGQMDATQDKAQRHILVLSTDYLVRKACLHEMNRAIALDPDFERGLVFPILHADCRLPRKIAGPNPLYCDLRDDSDGAQWTKLLDGCGAELGTDAASWLKTRDDTRRFLRRRESVNLVVSGRAKWMELIANLQSEDDPKGALPALAVIDLQSGATASRRGLVTEIIRALGGNTTVPQEPEDLVELDRFICARPKSYVVLGHFDYVLRRPQYGVDLFGALRHLVTDRKKLVLLIQSRAPLATLLPHDHPLSSSMTSLTTLDLMGHS